MTSTPVLAFGDDGSPAADLAWLAINSHRWPGWRLLVITAEMPPVGPPLPRDETELHAWSPPRPRPTFAEAQFATIEAMTARSDPRLVLSLECELVVIGPRGPGLLKALHLGSTAEWLLHHPPAPLFIARHGRRTRDVVVCTDNSPHAVRAMRALAALPWVDELRITALAVDDGRADAHAAVDVAAALLEPTGSAVDATILTGDPTPTIHGFLQERSPDLVVLGTRGLTGLRHLLVGSTASGIARTATCSVLVACDEAG